MKILESGAGAAWSRPFLPGAGAAFFAWSRSQTSDVRSRSRPKSGGSATLHFADQLKVECAIQTRLYVSTFSAVTVKRAAQHMDGQSSQEEQQFWREFLVRGVGGLSPKFR